MKVSLILHLNSAMRKSLSRSVGIRIAMTTILYGEKHPIYIQGPESQHSADPRPATYQPPFNLRPAAGRYFEIGR